MSDEPDHRERDGSSLPFILIGLGLLVLFFNLGWLGDVFDNIFSLLQLWPIALIAVGADLLTRGRYRAIIIAAAVVVGLITLFVWQRQGSGSGDVQAVAVPLDAARRIELELDTGVTDVRLDSSADRANALSGEIVSGRRERVNVSSRLDDGTLEVGVISRTRGGPFGFFALPGISQDSRSWDLTLVQDVPVDLDIDIGVGDLDLDLRLVDLTNLEIDGGVGETHLTLPQNATFDATVDGGVGEITLLIPRSLPVRVDVDTGIGGVDIDDSFTRDGDTYTSAGYREGSGAHIRVEVGVGRVRVASIP